MSVLCEEAAMGPIRSVPSSQLVHIAKEALRPIEPRDFEEALEAVKASVSSEALGDYRDWNNRFGSVKVSITLEED